MLNWLERVFDRETVFSAPGEFRPSSNAGSPMKRERVLRDDNGVLSLETVGQTSLYDEIQAHKDSVDINKILERYRQGDVTALDRVKAQYLDIADAPKSLAEMYSFVQNCSKFFEQLPLAVREEYDHNPAKFVADIGSDRFVELFKPREDDSKKVQPIFKDEKEVIENA